MLNKYYDLPPHGCSMDFLLYHCIRTLNYYCTVVYQVMNYYCTVLLYCRTVLYCSVLLVLY